MNKNRIPISGFTILELMIVVCIIGLLLGLILPRAFRAQYDAKFGVLRQAASETGAYVTMYAQEKAAVSALNNQPLTPGDILLGTSGTGQTQGMAFHYTGHPCFDEVQARISKQSPMVNPFNAAGIFEPENDDEKIPAERPGLIYLAALTNTIENSSKNSLTRLQAPGMIDFYFIFTEKNGWYKQSSPKTLEGLRKGIYIGRYSAVIH